MTGTASTAPDPAKVLSPLRVSLAQQMLPSWVRARGMSYYLMASQGGMAAGSFLWGVEVRHHVEILD